MASAHAFDLYGNRLSTHEEAASLFNAGLYNSLTFDRSGIEPLRQAVAEDPKFALGHALLARQLIIHGHRSEGKKAFERAFQAASPSSGQELSALNALHAATTANPKALQMCLDHLDEWPVDIIVAPFIVGPFGLMSNNDDICWREANFALAKKWAAVWPENDWWLLSTLAFGAAEAGHAKSALDHAARSLELRDTGAAAHAYSHAQIELNLTKEGHQFAVDWLAKNAATSDMQHHISWHRAIFEYDDRSINHEALHAQFNQELSANISDPMPLSTFADNASFLWRVKLRGFEPSPAHVHETLEYMDQNFPKGGFAFADLNRICITALCNENNRRQELLSDLDKIAHSRGTNTAKTVAACCRGFFHFADELCTQTVEVLGPVLDQVALLGGSNPQRHVVQQTYDAAMRKINE